MDNRNRNSLLTKAIFLLIFTSCGNGAYQDCVSSLRNTVVYEGTPDTILSCTAETNGSAWLVKPTSLASGSYPITNFDDTVSPTLKGLYAINGSGLIVRNATITPTGGPISTAGLYFVRFSGTTNQTAAKLVVIRSGPNCSYIQLASDAVNISCNIVYADHPVAPMKEIINCTASGQVYTLNTPPRTPILYNSTYTLNVYNSTSTITINNTAPATYDCKFTFASPPESDLAKYPYLARNAPDFKASFTVCEGPTTTAPSTTPTKPLTTTTPLSTTVTTEPHTATTTSLPLTTTPAPSTTVSDSKEILLAVEVVLAVIFGCLLLTTVVCWCWCWCWWFGRYPRFEVFRPRAYDYGFRGGRYIKRYTGNSFRRIQLRYQEQPFY